MGSREIRISILLVYFSGEDIYQCSDNSSAFQAAYVCCIFVRRSPTCCYECFCLSGNDEFVH
jgi:hypothetical protein